MRAFAFSSRGVTTVRKSRRRRGPERGNLHGRVRRRGKQRRADLAWRRREHLRPSHVGGCRNDKDRQQRSSQKEHAVCLHALQIYDRSKRNVSLIGLVPTRFVLSPQVLICSAKISRTCRCVPFNVGAKFCRPSVAMVFTSMTTTALDGSPSGMRRRASNESQRPNRESAC